VLFTLWASSLEIVEISWKMLFLSSYRVLLFVLYTLSFKLPTNESYKVLNQANVGTKTGPDHRAIIALF
jgi:hypothetical protein